MLTSPPSRDLAEAGPRERLGNQRHGEAAVIERADGQADAVDGDGALLDQIARELGLGVDLQHPREPLLAHRADGAGAVDVALDDVSTEAIAGAQRELQVHDGPGLQCAQARSV